MKDLIKEYFELNPNTLMGNVICDVMLAYQDINNEKFPVNHYLETLDELIDKNYIQECGNKLKKVA